MTTAAATKDVFDSAFRLYVRQWVPDAHWPAADLRQVVALLREISLANGGAIALDAPLRFDYQQDFVVRRAIDVLDRRARSAAGAAPSAERVLQDTADGPHPTLPFVKAQAWTPTAAEQADRSPFDTYVRQVFRDNMNKKGTAAPPKKVIAELRSILKEVQAAPHRSASRTGFTRASTIVKDLVQGDMADLIATDAGAAAAVLLRGGAYLPFVTKLLAAATSRIHIMMFFFKFEDAPKYPTDALVDEIIRARGRGLDVKVILDRDAADSAIGSSRVNAAVFAKLRASRVPVVFDPENVMTHAKILLVDNAHVVVGSHNWTSGSFYVYDDTSVYVESTGLAARYTGLFNDHWRQYEPHPISWTPDSP